MQNLYQKLLKQNLSAEKFTRKALSLLEAQLREMALLILQDLINTGFVIQKTDRIQQALGGITHPAWGNWNFLIRELNNLYNYHLEAPASTDKDNFKKLEQANILDELLLKLTSNVKSTDTHGWISALYRFKDKKQKPPRSISLQQLLTDVPIYLRNQIVHSTPDDKSYWQNTTTVLTPLIQWLADTPKISSLSHYPHKAPWFIDDGKSPYNGLSTKKDIAFYPNENGVPQAHKEMAREVLLGFKTLFGEIEKQDADFLRLLNKYTPEDLKGVIMGDFLVGKFIGEGAYGKVHKGRQLSTGRQVAIKLLRDEANDIDIVRFKQEAELLGRLNHPNIVDLISYGKDTWYTPKKNSPKKEDWYKTFAEGSIAKHYISMEWIEGQTLDDYYHQQINQQYPPNIQQLTQWFIDISDALVDVHKSNVVHRDIKPSNLMITETGNIKLLDFGIARSFNPQDALYLTKEDENLGTLAYMAPEQIAVKKAKRKVGKAADIYGLTAVFYELYTQKRLFDHNKETDDTISEIKKSGTKRPEIPLHCKKSLAWEIKTILQGGLENEIKDRYQSISELKRDLIHYQNKEAIEYERPNLWRRTSLWYQRNHKVINISGFFTALLIGATVYYIISITQAEKQAKDERDRAIELINYMNFGLRDKLTPIGKLDIMDGVQQRIKQYFESIDLKQNDLQSLWQKAIGLMQYAETLRKQGKTELKQVEQLLFQANQDFQRLVKQQPDNELWQNGLLASYERLADLYLQTGDKDKAAVFYQNSFKIAKKLTKQAPSNVQWQHDLSISYNKLADLYLYTGDENKSASFYQNALEITKKLTEQDPSNVQWQRDLIAVYQRLADLYLQTGDKDKAASFYQNALEITKKLTEQDPSNMRWQDDLSISYNKLADFYRQTGDKSKAASFCQNALEITKKLADNDPNNMRWQRDLLIRYYKLADLALQIGDKDKAASIYQKLLNNAKKLAEKDPSNVQRQRGLSISYDKLADVYRQTGDKDKAVNLYQDSLDIRKKLTEKDPDNVQWQRDLSANYNKLADLYLQTGDKDKAARFYQNSLDIRKKLTEKDPSDGLEQRALSKSYDKLADLYLQTGDKDKAARFYQDSFDIRKKLTEKAPSTKLWQHDLSVSYDKLADLYLQTGNKDKAANFYQNSLDIRKKLTEKSPDTKLWQHDLSVSYDKLADFYRQIGDKNKAINFYEKAIEILIKSCEIDPNCIHDMSEMEKIYIKLADIYWQTGKKDKATNLYNISLDIIKKLTEQDPSNVEYQRDLVLSYAQQSEIKPEKAKYYLQQALDIVQSLKQQNKLAADDEWLEDELKQRLKEAQ